MNLLALQYGDINRAIESATSHSEFVQARAVFPNSLLSTEVQVTLSNSGNSNKLHQAGTPAYTPNRMLDYPFDNSLYYHLQDPLPDYLGKQLYRAGAHIVGLLENVASLSNIDTAMVDELFLLLNRDQSTNSYPRTQFFIHSDISQLYNSKNQNPNWRGINIRKLSHVSHRLTVIGKASLVLCDSPGIALDAIRSSVPAALVGTIAPEFEILQASISRYLKHENYQQLLAEQQRTVDVIIRNHCQHSFVMSNLSTLHTLLAAQPLADHPLAENDNLHEQVANTQTQSDLILSSQLLLFSNQNKTVRLKSGLESGRRKLQKFKESPARFMEDSQSRILRSFASNKTQQ